MAVYLPGFVFKLYERHLWGQIKNGPVPRHVGLIMDGNRRAARALGKLPHDGHRMGFKKVRNVLRWCWALDIRVVTLFAFSTENFLRPPIEVDTLMRLAREQFLAVLTDPDVHKHEVQVKAIGRLHLLPSEVQDAIHQAEKATAHYDRYTLQVAIGYGGRAEVVDAVRAVARKVKEGNLTLDAISEKYISQHLYTNGTPDPDIIIRTSGEERLSGFLLWQSAYSEFYFADVFFPNFRKIDLWRAIRTYQRRDRRFGT